MKKVAAAVIAGVLMTGTVSYAYELPHSFWAPNNNYSAAYSADDCEGIIKYGNQIIDIIRNEPLNEQTGDIMGSRLYVVGNTYERIGEYEKAAQCFEEYIPYGEYRGWDDGVKIAKSKIMQFTPIIELYTPSYHSHKYYGAVNEPQFGTLVGQTGDSETLDGESMILLYQEYGNTIMPWFKVMLSKAQQSGRAVEIALNFPGEGNQLESIVNDSRFLNEFTELIKEYPDIPIYLRIGAEANIWKAKGDAELYKRVFRKIADEIHFHTDNVATVWSMGHTSSWYINMDDYYPGDEYVDWVGVSAYCKKYFEGKVWEVDEKFNEVYFKSGDSADPVLLIKEVVDRYGGRKPIMLAECGVDHHTSSDTIDEEHTDWALGNMEKMYNYIPMVYPQVKLIAYFNKYMDGETSDYSISGNAALTAKYRELIRLPHFIKNRYSDSAEVSYQKLSGEVSASGEITLMAYTHVFGGDNSKVDYYINGRWVAGSSSLPYKKTIDLRDYSDGRHELKAVLESGGKYKTEKKLTLNISRIKIKINGSYAETDAPPFIENDRTYVPVRLISENLGCEVSWEQDTQTAVVKRQNTEIRMTLGSRVISVNGREVAIDAAVQIRNDRTFLPVRAVSEILGASVDWDGNSRCVIVED